MINVAQAWRSLSAEQKQILVDKRIDANRSVDELLALMKPLAACDTMADKVRTKLGCSFALAIVLTIFGFIVLANTVGFAIGVVVGLLLLATAIGLGFFYFWTKKIDVSNNFRQF